MNYQFLGYFLSAYTLVLGSIIIWFIMQVKQEKHWQKNGIYKRLI
jgi:uncharacterized membrane protein